MANYYEPILQAIVCDVCGAIVKDKNVEQDLWCNLQPNEDYPHVCLIISQINEPIDCYQAANMMFGVKPGDEKYNKPQLAQRAAKEMVAACWKFQGYNDYGESLYLPPKLKCEGKIKEDKDGYLSIRQLNE